MPEVNGKGTFEERVNIILDELSLGIKWDRPCLIIAVYRSEYTKAMVQSILAKALGESGQGVLHYSVDKQHYDVPLELMEHPKHKQTVYFVGGLRWGGGRRYSNAYRALNMHREYLVDGNVRAIFWVTKNEARQLARFSPDFWAFRHKVIEFPDLPSADEKKPLESSNGSFHRLYSNKAKDFQTWINTAESFCALGCMDEAILNFRKALRKYPDETAISLRIAEIYLSIGRVPAASRILKKAGKGKADNNLFLKELGRLNQAAHSRQQPSGGLLDQTI